MLASDKGHSEIVNLLIEAGADVKAKSRVSAHHRHFFVACGPCEGVKRGGEER